MTTASASPRGDDGIRVAKESATIAVSRGAPLSEVTGVLERTLAFPRQLATRTERARAGFDAT